LLADFHAALVFLLPTLFLSLFFQIMQLGRPNKYFLMMMSPSSYAADPFNSIINYWAALELLEEQLAIDSFALAQLPRPKISCWSCRRVDHILLST